MRPDAVPTSRSPARTVRVTTSRVLERELGQVHGDRVCVTCQRSPDRGRVCRRETEVDRLNAKEDLGLTLLVTALCAIAGQRLVVLDQRERLVR